MPKTTAAIQRPAAILCVMVFIFAIIGPMSGWAQSTLEYMTLQTQAQGGAQQALRQPAQDNTSERDRANGLPADWMGMLKDIMNAVTTKIPPAQLMIILGLLTVAIVLLRK